MLKQIGQRSVSTASGPSSLSSPRCRLVQRVAPSGSVAAGSPGASRSPRSPRSHRVERATPGHGLARSWRGARRSPRRRGRGRRAGGRGPGRDRVEPAAPGPADGRAAGPSRRSRAAPRRPRRRTAGGPVGGADRGRNRGEMARRVATMAERAPHADPRGSRDAGRTARAGRRGAGRAHPYLSRLRRGRRVHPRCRSSGRGRLGARGGTRGLPARRGRQLFRHDGTRRRWRAPAGAGQ
jgi:hypothetical protein